MKWLFFLVAHLSYVVDALSVQVVANGEAGDGKLIALPSWNLTGVDLCNALAGHLPWEQRGELPFFVSERAIVFASSRGNLQAEDMRMALQDKERLFVVPEHRQFIHPVDRLGRQVQLSVEGANGKPVIITPLAQKPRIFHVANLLDQSEMDALMKAAEPSFEPSTVGEPEDAKKGINHADHRKAGAKRVSTRTSDNAWAQHSAQAMLYKRRAMAVLGLQSLKKGAFDDDLMDGLQVVRYQKGQSYDSHMDYMPPTNPLFNYEPSRNGSNRFATIFLYLVTCPLGGQTHFPKARAQFADLSHGSFSAETPRSPSEVAAALNETFQSDRWEYRLSQGCFNGISVYPRKGDAIIFYNQDASGNADQDTLHAGCPVIEGEKWGANLWVWNKPRQGTPGAQVSHEMQLKFHIDESSNLIARVYWVDGGSKHLISELNGARRVFATNTFHSHKFDIYVKDSTGVGERLVGSVTANKLQGAVQSWTITESGVASSDGRRMEL